MICPYCKNEAEFVSNEDVYGYRIGESYMMWWCRSCDARIGVHHNDPDKPLGTMANAELRDWRIKAHNHIDPLWRNRLILRRTLYRILAKRFGFEVHIGKADIKLCQAIIALPWNFYLKKAGVPVAERLQSNLPHRR